MTKLFNITNLEMFGCPFNIIIMADTLDDAMTKLADKHGISILDLRPQMEIDEIDDGYLEVSIG